MRKNLAKLAIVLILIAIGLTLFGGPLVIGAGGWPVVEMWSVQFWAVFMMLTSAALIMTAAKSHSDAEAIENIGRFILAHLMAFALYIVVTWFAIPNLGGTIGLFLLLVGLCLFLGIPLVLIGPRKSI